MATTALVDYVASVPAKEDRASKKEAQKLLDRTLTLQTNILGGAHPATPAASPASTSARRIMTVPPRLCRGPPTRAQRRFPL